jgi:hypothetical protein
MANHIQRRFHRVGVAVAVLIALAGGSWTVAAALFARSLSDGAILGIGAVATVVLALAAWVFYCVLGWVVAGLARLLRRYNARGKALRPLPR